MNLKKRMHPEHDPKVLVVGTTADYIDWIRCASPGRALFVTEPEVRRTATEATPAPDEEILTGLEDHDLVLDALRSHLRAWNYTVDGIACFDCESLELASVLAEELNLKYPSPEAVRRCRDKYVSKLIWQENGAPCPRTRMVSTRAELGCFAREAGFPCVLKPLTGSGSELVFCCTDGAAGEKALTEIRRGLEARKNLRMYGNGASGGPWIVAEEFIDGVEYSCDFLIREDRVDVMRLTRKIRAAQAQGPFGTIRGYALATRPPGNASQSEFEGILRMGAQALGIFEAICMVDFIVRNGRMVLLEMTPRPGGDCLPFLLRAAGHFDPLLMALDFAQQRPLRSVPYTDAAAWVGLRLHAGRSGVLRAVDIERLLQDPRVRDVHLIRGPGHVIRMPPEDYDSWLLGHVIVEPFAEPDLETQCHELFEKFRVEIDS